MDEDKGRKVSCVVFLYIAYLQFYRFLTRSRSRSRSKDDDRPMSSTTTATTTTIKPKQTHESSSNSRPSTPKGTRSKIQNLFRKSSLASRPPSPEPTQPVPSSSRLPRPTKSDDNNPQLWTTRTPSRPSSPAPVSKTRAMVAQEKLNSSLRVSHPRPKANPGARSASDPTQKEQTADSSNRRDPIRPRASSFSREPSNGSTTSLTRAARLRKDSVESGYRYRPMAMLDEEKPSNHVNNPNSKPSMKTPGGLRATRHGSFDFERPGWAAGSIVRSPSGGSVGTNHSKESTENGRLAVNNKHHSRVDRTPPHSEPGHGSPSQAAAAAAFPSHARSKSARDHPPPPPPPPEPSSLGRKTGKRTLRTGIAKLVGLSHGPFAFEPPVPSPTASTMSEKSAQESMRGRETREQQKESDKARQREKERKRAARRTTHLAAGPEPPPPPPPPEKEKQKNPGFRSGEKGRSLDLGLGLAWAPTKIRQDALMPSSVVFGKGLSASTSSRNGLMVKVDTIEVEVDRSKIGREVAEAFRSALDDEAYIAFKKYVRRFDAHDIPFDGPTGILARAERLLDRSSNLPETHKRKLLDRLVRIILQNS